MSELEFQPLTRDRLPDLANLFGQGGDPRWCWCSFGFDVAERRQFNRTSPVRPIVRRRVRRARRR